MTGLIAFVGAALCSTLLADDVADRAQLVGAWADKDAGVTWVVEQKGNSMHIAQSHNGQELSRLDCSLDGRECQVKESGHTVKVMLWFNGPKLVEMETRGSEVVKRLFSASADSMEIQVVPIVPDGKAQVVTLKRTKPAAQ